MPEGLEVKICGLTRTEDVRAAVEAGADYVGVVLSAGFRRSVDPSGGRALVEGCGAVAVAVLVDESVDGARARAEALGAGVVQLHGEEPEAVVEAIRASGPWRVWKTVRARDLSDVERAGARYADVADGLLVEGWREGVVGGGGAGLDRALLPGVRATIPPELSLILAGGLDPANVSDAVAASGADVVDVSSGVERETGIKSPELIREFVRAARRGATARRARRP